MGCKTLALMEVLLATWVAATPAAAITVSPAGADAPGLVLLTIADGEVAVLRGRMRFVAVEGQRLLAQDIVHTSAVTRVARLEFTNGSVLDLGPATQVLLAPQGGAWPKERPAMAYVARGWAKLRAPRAADDGASVAGLASAWLDVAAPQGGVVLARIEAQAAFAFVESGRAQLVEYRAARAPRELALGEGHAYQRDAGAELGIASLRPAAALLRATPRALADALPPRAASFAQRPEPPAPSLQPVAPGDTAAWLDTEPALRAAMHARFVAATPPAARGIEPRTDPPLNSAAAKPARARPPAAALAPARIAQLGHQRLVESRATTTGAATPIELDPTELVAVQSVLGSAPLPDAAVPAAVATPASPAATPIAPAKPMAAATATPPPKPTSARAARRARTES